MTQSELYAMLKTLGYPVAYGQFTSPQEPPFITYQYAYSNDFFADGMNYIGKGIWQIELYTEKKEPSVEKQLENVLKSNSLTYMKSEVWLDDENLWQMIYEIEILEG